MVGRTTRSEVSGFEFGKGGEERGTECSGDGRKLGVEGAGTLAPWMLTSIVHDARSRARGGISDVYSNCAEHVDDAEPGVG